MLLAIYTAVQDMLDSAGLHSSAGLHEPVTLELFKVIIIYVINFSWCDILVCTVQSNGIATFHTLKPLQVLCKYLISLKKSISNPLMWFLIC